jgi:stage II sporulation protein D
VKKEIFVQHLIKTFLLFLFCASPVMAKGQVKIRLFSEKQPSSTLFAVTKGSYTFESYNGERSQLREGDYLVISLSNEKLGVKNGTAPAFYCDSISLVSNEEGGRFTLRINGQSPERRRYSGNLGCKPDMGTMVFINQVDIEEYVAGVVRAEGGPGRDKEYIKTQAILARTYLYKYIDKHIIDGFDLCDDTHCQAYFGITDDTSIVQAVEATKGMVIIDADSVPILAAFHSNCGGETARSEDVWLTGLPYLTKKTDPHCRSSNNALWEKTIPLGTWVEYLKNKGYNGTNINELNFTQTTRKPKYVAGEFSFPLTTIRTDFGLRSTFFSIKVRDDKIVISGKGYGHGVGLCQEGAMQMALKGYSYEDIIEFYYTGATISKVFKKETKQ